MFLIEAETAEGTKVINGKCWVKDVDGQREVWVNWSLFLKYPVEDAPSRRFAAACLARCGVASKTKIADAFGFHRNYVTELTTRLENQGLEGMLEGKRGPKGPHKLHPQMRRRARELRRQGLSLQGIAKQLQKEWRVSISHTSVRRMVIGVETEGKDGEQAWLDGTFGLAVGEGRSIALRGAGDPDVNRGGSDKGKEHSGGGGVGEQPVEPELTEGREFSGAGGFLYYPALATLGLVDVFQKVYHELASRRCGLREFVLTLFFVWAMGFSSLESLKGAERRGLGCLIGASDSPVLKTAWRKLQDLAERKQGDRLAMEMAQRYVDGDDAAQAGGAHPIGHRGAGVYAGF